MKSGIYKIRNLIDEKFYIGSSKDIDHRWTCHKRRLNNNEHDNPILQNAWNKYGKDSFVCEVIELVDNNPKLLFEREEYYFKMLNPHNNGYNIETEAKGGDAITNSPNREAFIEKMKIINRGENNGMYGKTHSKDAIKKQKDKAKGRYTLEWFIEKYGQTEGEKKFQDRNTMLKNRKINYSYDNKMTGTKRGPMTDEVKKRISDRKARMKMIKEDLQKDILSNQFTMIQLSEKYGVSMSTIKAQKRKVL